VQYPGVRREPTGHAAFAHAPFLRKAVSPSGCHRTPKRFAHLFLLNHQPDKLLILGHDRDTVGDGVEAGGKRVGIGGGRLYTKR